MAGGLVEWEWSSLRFLRTRSEPVEQRLAARDDEAGMAANHLRPTGRQMKLAPADVDPHIAVGHHQIGITSQPEACDIEQGGQALIGHLHVDVFEMDRVAEILGGPVECLLHEFRPPKPKARTSHP